ncbi:MAG: thioredoxin family protein [Pseudomonadota bacterium]
MISLLARAGRSPKAGRGWLAAALVFLALGLALALCLPAAASADPDEAAGPPVVKIINFTADWCPNCQILDPRIAEALEQFSSAEIGYVELDLTQAKRADPAAQEAAIRAAIEQAGRHQAGYLWDWYGGLTGISVLISADNGEPISCLTRALSVEQIVFRLQEAVILSRRAPPGRRKPSGPDCPAPGAL